MQLLGADGEPVLQANISVTASTGLRDDRAVGLSCGFFRLEAGKRVIECFGAEDDRERIGVALLVDRAEAIGEVALGDREHPPRRRKLAPRLCGLTVDRGGLNPQRRKLCLRPRELAVQGVERQNRGSRSGRDRTVLLRQPLCVLPERGSGTGAARREHDGHRSE